MSVNTMNPAPGSGYPASLNIDYPDRPLNRLTSFFRIFMMIPILAVLWAVTGVGWTDDSTRTVIQIGAGIGILFLPLLLMILFRQKYPRWWFDWNLQLTRFSTRVSSYFMLLRDEYPSTDEQQNVHLDLVYPDAQNQLGRGLPLIKWFLAIPHYIVLAFLHIGVFVVSIIAWFAILFTGRYPRSLFDYVVGVNRWSLRVQSYAFTLITDKYPPFSLE
jgi:hypothetical protein